MIYSHKNVKRFHIDGLILDEKDIPAKKESYMFILSNIMRSQGYLPRIDIDPDFTVSFEDSRFKFDLSLYGTYVGRKVAECNSGINKNRPISIQENRLKELSME